MTMLQRLFSFEGRIGRARYWVTVAGLASLLVAMAVLVRVLLPAVGLDIHPAAKAVLSSIVSIPLFVAILAVNAKRLHDLNRSAWWVLVVPVLGGFVEVGWDAIKGDLGALIGHTWRSAIEPRLTDALLLAYFALLGAIPGTRGPNRYGADPSGREQSTLSQP